MRSALREESLLADARRVLVSGRVARSTKQPEGLALVGHGARIETCTATVGSGAMSQRRSRAGTGSPSASVATRGGSGHAGFLPSSPALPPLGVGPSALVWQHVALGGPSFHGSSAIGTVIGDDREVPDSPRWPGGHRCFHPGRLRGHLRRVRRGTAAACRAAIWDAMAVEELREIVTRRAGAPAPSLREGPP